MPAHTIMEPPPHLSASTIQLSAYRSPWHLQIRVLPSALQRWILHSSVKRTDCHCALLHRECLLDHWSHHWQCLGIKIGPTYGLLACSCISWSRRRTVVTLIGRAFWAAVTVAGLNLSRKWTRWIRLQMNSDINTVLSDDFISLFYKLRTDFLPIFCICCHSLPPSPMSVIHSTKLTKSLIQPHNSRLMAVEESSNFSCWVTSMQHTNGLVALCRS